jgi:predicted Zn-ribbon and HTH transcriptional regulator
MEINNYVEAITQNLEKLLYENEKMLALLAEQDPEKADQIMRDIRETMEAVKSNDINRINKIYERYADNVNK